MTSRGSCSFSAHIQDYLSGRMPDDEAVTFEQHFNDCPRCLALLGEQTKDCREESWLQTLRDSGSLQTASYDITRVNVQPEPAHAEPAHAGPAHAGLPPAESGLRYSWTRLIGTGGSGNVWEAHDQILQRTVAIKLLRSSAPTVHESQRLLQEASALARLAHTHIVGLHEVEDIGGQPALIMEFVAGPSLATWLRGQPGPPVAAAQLLEKLCQAVEYAHAQGVRHRDLKPSNILLKPLPNAPAASENSRIDLMMCCPKIADFGLARLIDQPHLTLSGQQIGTPSYMAPEQVSPGSGISASDPSVDIYGLGAVLYELLTGRPPFVSSDPALTMAMILREDPVSPRSLVPAIPRDLETICLKCLSKEPQKRYPSATALRNDIIAFLDNRPISARPVSRLRRLINWCRRHPAEALAAAASTTLVLALILAALWYASIQRQLSREALAKAELAADKQLLQEQQQEAVRAGFDRLVQSHFLFNAMIEDPRALEEGGLQRIRQEGLQIGGRFAREYLQVLDHSLHTGQELTVEQIRTGIDSLIMAMQADVIGEFEPTIEMLRQRVSNLPADAVERHARLEMEIRICNLQARCFAKNQQHTEAGDTYCRMASLIRQQALTQPPSHPWRNERTLIGIGMLLNAAGAYLTGDQRVPALQTLQQAEQTAQNLIHEDPQNLDHLTLLLEVRLRIAQLLPPEQAIQLAAESLQTLTTTPWNTATTAEKARFLQEKFRPMTGQ